MASVEKIYHDILMSLLLDYGFEFDSDQSNAIRCYSRFIWHPKYDGQPGFQASRISLMVIPIGSSLILHGILIDGPKYYSYKSVKLLIQNCKDLFCIKERLLTIRKRLEHEFVSELIAMVSVRIDALPTELKLKILAMVSPRSILRMSAMSHEWNRLAQDERIWKGKVERHYSEKMTELDLISNSWKGRFQYEYVRRRFEFAIRFRAISMIEDSPIPKETIVLNSEPFEFPCVFPRIHVTSTTPNSPAPRKLNNLKRAFNTIKRKFLGICGSFV